MPLVLPSLLNSWLAKRLSNTVPKSYFTFPKGEAALSSADSVSWRVFKNPVVWFVGGIAAVILELAEPRVRSGVWQHTSFRRDPVARMERTGLAAMISVYSARSVAEQKIAAIRELHSGIEGKTPSGIYYRANDPELLDWVHTTASFGFLESYCAYVRPLHAGEQDSFYAEARTTSEMYGASGALVCVDGQRALFEKMHWLLEPSPIISQFLSIVCEAPFLPQPARSFQRSLVSAAIAILPANIRCLLGLDDGYSFGVLERTLVRTAAMAADTLVLPDAPPAQACVRMGLPPDHLYK